MLDGLNYTLLNMSYSNYYILMVVLTLNSSLLVFTGIYAFPCFKKLSRAVRFSVFFPYIFLHLPLQILNKNYGQNHKNITPQYYTHKENTFNCNLFLIILYFLVLKL